VAQQPATLFSNRQWYRLWLVSAPIVLHENLEIASTTTAAYTKYNVTGVEDWSVGADNSGFVIYNDTDGQYRMVIDESGNIGIGTNNPTTGFGRNVEISGTGAVV